MILAIIQARMTSTRLPGKVLMPLGDKPSLIQQFKRVAQSRFIDKVIIATSEDAADDAIDKLCQANGICVFRGSLANVLDRFYQAASSYSPSHVVRLTADCPFADPDLIDQAIARHLVEKSDYCSNCFPATFADGFDVEVFTYDALKQAWQQATTEVEKEHVTPWITNPEHNLKRTNIDTDEDSSDLRLTVDHPEDYELCHQVWQSFYPRLSYREIINQLRNRPDLIKINAKYKRNEALTDG